MSLHDNVGLGGDNHGLVMQMSADIKRVNHVFTRRDERLGALIRWPQRAPLPLLTVNALLNFPQHTQRC